MHQFAEYFECCDYTKTMKLTRSLFTMTFVDSGPHLLHQVVALHGALRG